MTSTAHAFARQASAGACVDPARIIVAGTALGITIRRTTPTWIERHYGYATARAYAGHTDTNAGTTATYVKATLAELATALAILTGEPHPLTNH